VEDPVPSAARKLHDFIIVLNELFRRGSGPSVVGPETGNDFSEIIVKVTSLVSEARDEILHARFSSNPHYHVLINRLNIVQKEVLIAIAKNGREGISGVLVSELVIAQILSIAEQVEQTTHLDALKLTRE
jgi:hypothetical protein